MDKISQNSDIINSKENTAHEFDYLLMGYILRMPGSGYVLGPAQVVTVGKKLRFPQDQIVICEDSRKQKNANVSGEYVGYFMVPSEVSSVNLDKKTSSFAIRTYLEVSGHSRKLSKEGSPSPRAPEAPVTSSSGSPAIVPDYHPSLAVYIDFVDLRKRLDSFVHWPDTHVQSPQELAAAGFFHTGDGDYLRCHYCGLGLRNWHPDDRPLDEHLRRRPSCGYLRFQFGKDVIAQTKARLQNGGPVSRNRESNEESRTGGLDTEGAVPPPGCPEDLSTTSPRPISTSKDNLLERNTEVEESTGDALLDMIGTSRPVAPERTVGENVRPPLHPMQSAPDLPVDLLAARSQRDVDEVSSLLAEISSTGSKNGHTGFGGDQVETGNNDTSYNLEKIYAQPFPSDSDVKNPAMKFKRTKPKPPTSSDKGDDGKADTSSHATEHMPHFLTSKPEASHDRVNNVYKAKAGLSVQDGSRDIQEALCGKEMPLEYLHLSNLHAFPMIPRNTEEGLGTVNFRSPPRERMHVEGFRMGTFLYYPRADEHAVLRLANAGFYYTGRDDTLACFCCDVTFSYGDRRPDEDPYEIHRQLNPNCPHLAGRDAGNVFIQDEQVRATSGMDITGSPSRPSEAGQLVSEARQNVDRLFSSAHFSTGNQQSQNRLIPENLSCSRVPYQNGNTDDISNRQQPQRETANRLPASQVPPRTVAGYEAGDPSVLEGSQAPTDSSEPVYNPARAVYPVYTNLSQRENSFSQWPHTHTQSPRELALAGFFFTSVGDCVRCYYCGLGLNNWDPDDRPLDEHMRWRSTCGFLRHLCGDDFIERTLRRLSSSSRERPVGVTTSKAAEDARAMGFSDDAIQRAIIRLLSSRAGPRAITTENLTNVILYLREVDKDSESSESNNSEDEGPPSAVEAVTGSSEDTPPQAAADQPLSNGSPLPGQTPQQTLQELERENQELRERRRCKICLDNDVKVVFQPCGHLVCCAECARRLNGNPCPICRKNIICTTDTI